MDRIITLTIKITKIESNEHTPKGEELRKEIEEGLRRFVKEGQEVTVILDKESDGL